jgi:hypothetical protein
MHTYDATFESLLCPENKDLDLDLNLCGEWAIRAELARIAYIKAEESEDRLAQLKTGNLSVNKG